MKIKLSDSEWKIMNLLWEKAPRTMTQVTNAFKEEKGWSKHTVITFLKRMVEKGAIDYEEEGRTKQFYPLVKRENAVIQETEDFLDKVFKGKMGLMLNTMIQQKALSDEEIEELRNILYKGEDE